MRENLKHLRSDTIDLRLLENIIPIYLIGYYSNYYALNILFNVALLSYFLNANASLLMYVPHAVHIMELNLVQK